MINKITSISQILIFIKSLLLFFEEDVSVLVGPKVNESSSELELSINVVPPTFISL
jgi:hypothetical protein